MSVSRKDFIATAAIIKKAKEDHRGGAPFDCIMHYLEQEFADYFYAENGMFDRGRFTYACELGD